MSSTRKFLAMIVAVLVIAAGFLVWRFWGERYQLVLSEEQLIAKLNEKFPFEKTYFFVIALRLSNPKLALENGSNRIAFGCDVEANVKLDTSAEKIPGPLRGTARLSGRLRYDPSDGTFYLDQPEVENFDVAGIPEKWRPKVNEAASKAVVEFLSRAPLYKLRPTDFKQAAARLILRDVDVADKKLVITMGVG